MILEKTNELYNMRIKQLRIKGRIIRLFRLIVNTGYMLLHKRADEIVLNVSMNLLCNKVFHSNIGDDINYYLIKELSHKRIFNYWDFLNLRMQPYFMVIGSIIGWMTYKDSIIWGSGMREPDNPLPAIPRKVLAVRGPLTRKYLISQGVECPEIYGDPALLLPKIYPPPFVNKKNQIWVILNKNDMDYFKNLLIGLITGIAAYLNPISGEIKSLIAVFALNFICGLLTSLLINHESFSFKKVWRCIVEATIFFALVSCIYFIGEHKGNPEGALQCVSFITYSVFYFYGVNILRNIKEILPNSSNGYKVVAFLHYVLSVEFIKNIPYLTNYLQKGGAK